MRPLPQDPVDCGHPSVELDTRGRPRLIVEGGAVPIRIIELPVASLERLEREIKFARQKCQKATYGPGS